MLINGKEIVCKSAYDVEEVREHISLKGMQPTFYLRRNQCRNHDIEQLWVTPETNKRVWRSIPFASFYKN